MLVGLTFALVGFLSYALSGVRVGWYWLFFCCCCIGRFTRCLLFSRKVVGGKNCFFDQQLDFSFLFVVPFVTHTTHTHTIAKSNKKCNVHVLLHRALFGQPKNTSLRIGLSGIGVNLSGDMDN